MRVAGIGCRRGVAASEVLAAVEAARNPLRRGKAPPTLDALAAPAFKAQEPAIAAAAEALCLPLIAVTEEALKQASVRCLTRSAASLRATGVGSVAEAAALAGAGAGGRLLGPRTATGNVTCAIAEAGDQA